MTPLEALRAIGCTDDEIRARAEWLTNPADVFDEYAGNSEPHLTPLHRANAAVLRAAEHLGPIPLTRDTPLGTRIAHPGAPDAYPRWLVGWDGQYPVVKRAGDDYYRGIEDGWYVVKGAEG